MLTEKAIKMKNDFNDNGGASREESREMIDELIDNCKPIAEEFKLMFDSCKIDGYVLYRLIMDGHKMKETK